MILGRQTYILKPHIALCSYERVPYAYLEKYHARPRSMSEQEFRAALLCDGKNAIDSSPELDRLMERGFIEPCAGNEKALSSWQQHRRIPNRVMPWMGLEITARCNYNCIHCFNAADNQRLSAQMSLEQVSTLLDQAKEAGVNAFLLTGGEPLLHPQFMEIVEAIYARDMFVFEINTNGFFITRELLDRLAAFGNKPEIKISFDGLGYHDWMRGQKGAQEIALSAIELCVRNGFRTRVQTNINRRNKGSILETLELLDEMGVSCSRVIPTTPSTRWEMNAAGQSLEWAEYYEAFLEITAKYAKGDHNMEVDGWQAAMLYPNRKAFSLKPVRFSKGSFHMDRPCCMQLKGMASIAADGELYPCLQCSGWFSAHGVSLANVFKEGLHESILSPAYYAIAHATVADKIEHQLKYGNENDVSRAAEGSDLCEEGSYPFEKGAARCADCPWLKYCGGGCPALGGLVHQGDMLMPDFSSCSFFFDGWYKRFMDALSPWECLSRME